MKHFLESILKNLLPIAIFILVFLFYFSPVLFNLSSKTLGPFGDKRGLVSVLERGEPIFFNQPALGAFVSLLSRLLAPFAVYNITVLLSFPLTCFFASKFFRRFFDPAVSLVLAAVFAFSPYHILKIYNHVDLAQIWVFPLCFSTLLDFDREKNLGNTLKLSGALALSTLVSNYYGYFLLLITVLFFVIRWFQGFRPSSRLTRFSVLFNRRLKSATTKGTNNVLAHFSARYYRGLKSAITPYLLLIAFYLLFTVPFLLPYLRANYLGEGPVGVGDRTMIVGRGITDFAAFTARPWYFVTPSVYHPVFGKFAERIHERFRRTGYFLCDDFFAQEHSGIFLGWTNLILAVLAISAPPRKTRRVYAFQPDGLGNRREWVSVFLWLALALATLSGPPFFTISLRKIYLPSYVLMKAFPMFRTLARLGVPILLCVLVLAGYGLAFLKKRFETRYLLLVTCYLLLALFEFYNPPTITEVPQRGSVEYNELLEK